MPPLPDAAYIAEAGSIHWLDVTFDPRKLWEIGPPSDTFEPIELTPGGGIPLPITAAHKLDPSDREFRPVELTDFEVGRHGLPNPTDPQTCAAVNACFGDGACARADCREPTIDPPTLPPRGCPTDWVDTEEGSDVLCFPQDWVRANEIVLPDLESDCPRGQAGFGEGCEALGDCAPTKFAPAPSNAPLVLYVDPAAPDTGTGTILDPYRRIESAWRDGAAVMLTDGLYEASSLDLKDVSQVIGRCAESTELQFALRSSEAGRKSISGLAVRAARPLAATAADIQLSAVALYGSDVALTLTSASVTATRSLFSRATAPTVFQEVGVLLAGARLEASQSFFVERIETNGSTLSLDGSVVLQRRPQSTGDRVPATVDLRHSVARLNDVQVFSWWGAGVRLSNQGTEGPLGAFTATDLSIAFADNASGLVMDYTAGPISISRLAVTWRPGAPPVENKTGEGIKVTHAMVDLTDFTSQGTYRGAVSEASEVGSAGTTGLVINNAWISWIGDLGVGARSFSDRVVLSNAWMMGGEETLKLDQARAAIYHRAGVVEVNRVFMRPGGRFGISVESGVAHYGDIVVAGPHDRTLWTAGGASGTIERLRAVDGGRGVVMGVDKGKLEKELSVEHVDITFDPSTIDLLPDKVAFDVNGTQDRWSNFALRGVSKVRASGSGDIFTNGLIVTAVGGVDWPPDFLGMLSGVVVRTSTRSAGN